MSVYGLNPKVQGTDGADRLCGAYLWLPSTLECLNAKRLNSERTLSFACLSSGAFHETRFEPSSGPGRVRSTSFFTASSSKVYGAAANETIVSRTAEINGVKLHYITAGHGAPLILLHGYAETSLMWKPIIPVLAERFTVIAPDLPGIGDSDVPADGLEMKSAAIRLHDLAKSLGVQKAEVVGHDIGLM